MPEMDVIALLRCALEMDPNLTCVIATGQGAIATAVEAMKSGEVDYITRPFGLAVIAGPSPRTRLAAATPRAGNA